MLASTYREERLRAIMACRSPARKKRHRTWFRCERPKRFFASVSKNPAARTFGLL